MIREINICDQSIYVKLCEEFYGTPACDHPVGSNNFLATFEHIMQGSPYYKAFVIEYEGKDCGYANVAMSYSNEANGMTALIDELYIRKEYRSKGLGKEFFEYLFNNIKVARYRLEITRSNTRAKALYESLGFEVLDYEQMVKDIK